MGKEQPSGKGRKVRIAMFNVAARAEKEGWPV